MFTEKVLALTNEEAEKIRAAVIGRIARASAISFPHFSEPGTQFALETPRARASWAS